MNVEHVPIASLGEDPANLRKHPERNLETIKNSLRRFGQQKPIVVDATNTVRAGNGTLAAARALGWETIAVVRSDLGRTELTAYAIADNRTAELAEWDTAALATTLLDPGVGDVGFLNAEIEALAGKPLDDAPAPDEPLPAEKWMIVVTCCDEANQAELLERFAAEGLSCKALMG